jgi:hypothetical protein
MSSPSYLLHGAVHSDDPLVELLLSLLPVALIIGGGIGAYLLAMRDVRPERQPENASDEPV